MSSFELCTEEDVGISRYLNDNNLGFTGIIKERFSDFNVTEIDLSGKLVQLDFKSDKEAENSLAAKKNDDRLHSDLTPTEQALISPECLEAFKRIRCGELNQYDIAAENLQKDERKTIYGVVNSLGLTGETVAGENKKMIRVVPKTETSNRGVVRGVRGRSKQNKFLHFSLYKENMGTAECISLLARGVRTKEKFFTFAGTKDKRGRTLQRVAVSLIEPKAVQEAVQRLRSPVAVSNYSFHPQGLRLGDLNGNRFEVVIKDVNTTQEQLRPVMEHFTENGFINYYGMQRFGTSEVPTHQIGLAILKRDFQGAIDLILTPKKHQFKELRCALSDYNTDKDVEKALMAISGSGKLKYSLEGKLLWALKHCHGNDKITALKSIPLGTRLFYVHAYQSYIWNRMVSLRIERDGTSVLQGDLIIDPNQPSHRVNVKHIDADRLTDHSIYDVYLPLPGHSVILPSNQSGQDISSLLKEDGLEMSSFRSLTREYDLPGDYRTIITKASDVTWKLVSHDTIEDDLVHSSLELANAESPNKLRSIGSETGLMKSLVLGLSLNSSCYATMALREIMRVKTDIKSMKNIDDDINGAEQDGMEAEQDKNVEDINLEKTVEHKNGKTSHNGDKNDDEPDQKKMRLS